MFPTPSWVVMSVKSATVSMGSCNTCSSQFAAVWTGVDGVNGRWPFCEVSLLGAIISIDMTLGSNGQIPVFLNAFCTSAGLNTQMWTTP